MADTYVVRQSVAVVLKPLPATTVVRQSVAVVLKPVTVPLGPAPRIATATYLDNKPAS